MSLVHAGHPTYTIHCRQEYWCSELWCDCDIRCWSGILLWGRAVLSSVDVKCEASLSVVKARKYRSWSSEQQFFAFITYQLKTNERACWIDYNVTYRDNIACWLLVCYGLSAFTQSRRACIYFKLTSLFEGMILMFWWLSYYRSKDMLSKFVYMFACHNTSTVNRQCHIPTSIQLLQNMVSCFVKGSQHHMYLQDVTVQAVYAE
jgi:hypothetical protein